MVLSMAPLSALQVSLASRAPCGTPWMSTWSAPLCSSTTSSWASSTSLVGPAGLAWRGHLAASCPGPCSPAACISSEVRKHGWGTAQGQSHCSGRVTGAQGGESPLAWLLISRGDLFTCEMGIVLGSSRKYIKVFMWDLRCKDDIKFVVIMSHLGVLLSLNNKTLQLQVTKHSLAVPISLPVPHREQFWKIPSCLLLEERLFLSCDCRNQRAFAFLANSHLQNVCSGHKGVRRR